jgi:hypothetical protein
MKVHLHFRVFSVVADWSVEKEHLYCFAKGLDNHLVLVFLHHAEALSRTLRSRNHPMQASLRHANSTGSEGQV